MQMVVVGLVCTCCVADRGLSLNPADRYAVVQFRAVIDTSARGQSSGMGPTPGQGRMFFPPALPVNARRFSSALKLPFLL